MKPRLRRESFGPVSVIARGGLIGSLLVIVACSPADPVRPPGSGGSGSDGAIAITSVAHDPDSLAFTYFLTVDGQKVLALNSPDSIRTLIDRLAAGEHTIGTLSVPNECSGAGSRIVNVASGRITETKTTLQCTRRTGDLSITVRTTGSDLDGNGYILTTTGAQYPSVVGANQTIIVKRLLPGAHTVSFSGVELNCNAPAPSSVDITAGATTTVTLDVSCSAAAFVRVTTSVTGDAQDPDGISFRIDQNKASQLDRGVGQVTKVAAGAHSYAIADLQPNCQLSIPATGTVNPQPADTVSLNAAYTCAAIGSGTLGANVTDAVGDTATMSSTSQPKAWDIISFYTKYISNMIVAVTHFSRSAISNVGTVKEGIWGEICIDTDQNPATGTTPIESSAITGAQKCDFDVTINASLDTPSVYIYHQSAGFGPIGRVRVDVAGDSMTVYLPLEKLQDEGNVGLIVALGPQGRVTDLVPNSGEAVSIAPFAAVQFRDRKWVYGRP